MLFGVPERAGRRRLRRDRRRRRAQRRDPRRGRRGRRRDGRDERPVPRRVHRPRALRRARRRRLGRQRRHAGALRRDGAGPGGGGRPRARPVRDDGRPGRRGPARAGRAPATATRRCWPTPRSTPRRSSARSARPSSRRCRATGATYQQDPANARRGAARARPRPRRGRRHRDGQAGAALPRRAAPGRRRGGAARRAGRGLPGVRRVRDGRGGVREGLARPRARHRRDADLDPPGRRRHRADLLGGRGRAACCARARDDACPHARAGVGGAARRAPRPSRPAASTRRSAPSAPSAARRGSWCPATGPYLVDADGREYVDLVCSWGPLLLGHAHPAVVEAVQAAVARGTSFGTPTEGEVALAEEIVARVEPVEQVRLVSSGTEATMSAIRLARGFTGRTKVVKFAGCYHGHVDSLLAAAGSGVATLGAAGHPRRHRCVGRRHDRRALQRPRRRRGRPSDVHDGQIACVITEAAAGNMGVVPPRAGLQRRPRRAVHARTARCSSATR